MNIEQFFEKYNFAQVIFDPIPSYGGDWFFEINNLLKNAKKENGKNLFEEFYKKTYQKPIQDIFKTSKILDLNVGMICRPNSNNIGRCLKYSKIDFFVALTIFFNSHIDSYGKTEEQHRADLIELANHITEDNESLNELYAKALEEKAIKLKDVMDKEINSEYFEAAMMDYASCEGQLDFSVYIKSLHKTTVDFLQGMLKLGDFFDKDIDYKALYGAYDPDTFYLLFAKIIYEFNLTRERDDNILDNTFSYLYYYNEALDEVSKDNKKYNPKILFTLPNGKKIRYSRRDFQIEFKKMFERHPEVKSVTLVDLQDENKEKYKDINLMEKLSELYKDDVEVNWEFLPEGEVIRKGFHNSFNSKKNLKKDKHELINEVNMRIDILERSGYIGRPIKGLNTFAGYYAFVYPNGKVILEKFWENEENMIPAFGAATYVMNIDNFIELSKMSRINLIEYIKMFHEAGVKRVFHTSINNWQRNLYKEINGTYRLEDAIEFINSLRSGAITHE